MNQVFRITVGQDTLLGKLPSLRIGRGYSSVFHIAGVSPDTQLPPKVWVSVGDPTHYRLGEWSVELRLWVVTVGNWATSETGAQVYAVTTGGDNGAAEYIVGQGAFVVYANIAFGGSEGDDGTSVMAQLAALALRVAALEEWRGAFSGIATFDPNVALERDLRAQVVSITTLLKGGA
jgi:hypothetical protein